MLYRYIVNEMIDTDMEHKTVRVVMAVGKETA